MIKRVSSVSLLPEDWDSLAGEYFQTREFLTHCENFNHCEQVYYLAYDQETSSRLLAGAVCYSIGLDLFTYLGLPSPLRFRICGIPCSVSAPGLLGDNQAKSAIVGEIKKIERGICLFLNLIDVPSALVPIMGRTFPTMILDKKFGSYEKYLESLRAPYRRWIRTTLEKSARLSCRIGAPSGFSDRHYALYLKVLSNSSGKLETLSLDFFRHLPDRFSLESLYKDDELVAWNITVGWERRFYFFLVGFENTQVKDNEPYFSMLNSILRRGLGGGYDSIDFGQTTESAKCRYGARVEERYMAAWHRNRMVRGIIWLLRGLLAYNGRVPKYRVFKGDV